MTAVSKLRIGLIGCGMWADKVHVPYLLSRADVRIVAVSSCRTRAECEQKAFTHGIPQSFDDYEAMIQKAQMDAVLITTPHSMHYAQAGFCLERSLHVLVDKPLACCLSHAKELVALAAKQNKVLLVANQRRYGGGYQYMRRAVQSGDLGEVRLIHCLLAQPVSPDFENSWRSRPELSCGGILIDSGYHLLDSLLWVCGQAPNSVYAITDDCGAKAEDSCSILLEFSNKASATATIFRGAPQRSEQETLSLYASKGAIISRHMRSPDCESYELTHLLGDGTVVPTTYPVVPPEKWKPTANFVDSILRGDTVLSSGESNLSTVGLIEAIYRSAATGNEEVIDQGG